ncbi:hypothetical protein [Sediminibacterium sp.]|uniref:hypothetical protein n=1 Tax=Sediminibacterium sp. TaxID=1917865 RepID=UPI0025D6AAE9|nr:hypothetical protein [Sediminibacterium sp.]MBW0177577.1 hypothetical protein [Sediminibacterium sp.]
MKNRWIVFILLFGNGSLFGQTSQDIQIHDTRDTNLLPNAFHWLSSYAYRARFDFKYNHIVSMPGSGVYSTVLTIPQWPDNSGDKMHQLGFNNGGIFFRQGWPSGANWEGWRKVLVEDDYGNIGIGTSLPGIVPNASLSGTPAKLEVNGNIRVNTKSMISSGEVGNLQFLKAHTHDINTIYSTAEIRAFTASGYDGGLRFYTSQHVGEGNYDLRSAMTINHLGHIGIGSETPSEKLSVNGNVRAKKLIVSQTGWPDYVFDSSYSLRSLLEVETFIAKNKHLPDMPSAKEVEEKGISVGDNQALLLKKIEEMTLYLIELKKENEKQQKEIEKLKQRIK